MKTIILVFMTALTISISANGQTDNISIEQTIHQFAKATTDRDVHGMHYLLHEKFQSVEKSGILSKSEYMKMLGDESWEALRRKQRSFSSTWPKTLLR